MIIKEKLGNIKDFEVRDRTLDVLPIEWYETGKRILHKKTRSGREVILKFMNESPNFSQDDVLFEDDSSIIVIDILSCDAITIHPTTMHNMAKFCYEIGNKHLPLFYEDDAVLIPYDAPLFKWLVAAGFEPVQEKRKLLHQLKTTVSAHAHAGNNTSLFSKILKLTTTGNE